jgi:Na+:H+ antiporter, NhaA family
VPRAVVQPIQHFLHTEAAGGIVLAAATVVALVWANVDAGSYAELWSTELTLRLGSWTLSDDLAHLVNDGLMALFFFVIGLEVKRELAVGELADRRAALLPLCAAIGGMAVPALIFVTLTAGGPAVDGWGIPMATDIAFALGVLSVLGRRVPITLVAFLLSVAVVDDIGAIVVIALFYSGGLEFAWLAAAAAGLLSLALLNRVHVRFMGAYVVLGLLVWFAAYQSGVHATIAGVVVGLLTPARPFQRPAVVSAEARRIADETADLPPEPDSDADAWRRLSWLTREAISPLNRVLHALHPWTSFVVLPVFALANAGIVLDAEAVGDAVDSSVTLAIVAGLALGKPVGVLLGALVAVRLGIAVLPRGVRWLHVAGVGALAGIGFTVSLFITALAYDDPQVVGAAKIGILAASVVAAGVGASILLRARGDVES